MNDLFADYSMPCYFLASDLLDKLSSATVLASVAWTSELALLHHRCAALG